MSGPSLSKAFWFVLVAAAVQIALAVFTGWRYVQDVEATKFQGLRAQRAAEIKTLATRLQSILEKQEEPFVAESWKLLKELRPLATAPDMQQYFDAADYGVAETDLRQVESLTSRQQYSTAEGYLPNLQKFARDQVERADKVAQASAAAPNTYIFPLALLVGSGILSLFILERILQRSAQERLRIMQDNTERLQHGITLNSLFSGTDGFAKFDARFHDMAQALEAAQDRLRRGEARFRLVTENLPVGILIAQAGGVVDSSNPKAQEVIGATNARIKGKSIADFFVFGEQSFESLADSGKSFTTVGTKDDGTQFSAELTVSRYRDDAGDKLLLSFEDITWRTELERMKREFVAMVNHDIRTPLTSISAMLGMLSEGAYGPINERGQAAIENNESSLDHIMRLLNDLLQFEKMTSGNFQLTTATTSTKKIADRAVAVVGPAAKTKGVKIEAACENGQVVADEDRMVQVITNLLSNAVKFSPQEGTVFLRCNESNGGIRFEVQDQGPGIPAEHHARIFETFAQVKSVDFGAAKGMGLGLAICKQIVAQHGGAIGVESEEGKGATFWLTIPRK
jgi:PAS domain S-box-containing protein